MCKADNLFDITGKVVAITGAAGVLYGTVARELATRGAKVALLDLLGDKAQEFADQIKADGDEALAVACNVLDPASIQSALDAVLKSYGRVDVLINGAGGNRAGATVPRDGKFTDLVLEEVDKVFALNYKGTFLPTQIFCKYFAEKGKGIVVNTSSMSAITPLTNVPGYSNAKAAVTNFTQWLAVQAKVDFPDAEIRVNEIAPGFLDTTQNHRLLFEADDKTLTPRGHSIIAKTPFGRFGDPKELLGPILLLISDAGSFLHGTTIAIDGGFSIYSGVGPLDEKKPKAAG
ncbi:MAG: SDR family NAD(P)-dependent oxidoreductase [Armatimonadota bacterium]|jgi:NAD(P)-dependent dehydrogenase (short-subunit alcohol dehydrogenase family)